MKMVGSDTLVSLAAAQAAIAQKGVNKESGFVVRASVRGQDILAGVPDVVLTNYYIAE